MLHPENIKSFNALYLKLSDANPLMTHDELLMYTKMIYNAAAKADTELFKCMYMRD